LKVTNICPTTIRHVGRWARLRDMVAASMSKTYTNMV
jgi:hypothetical protein